MRFIRFPVIQFLILLLTVPMAWSAAPNTINYQGYLRNADNTPVTTTVPVVFRLYDAPAGGNVLWSETVSVTPSNGIFQAELGKTQPLSPQLFANQVYLGMQIGTDSEMAPRQAITTVPHALRASVADGVSSPLTATALADGSVTPVKLDTAYVKRGGDTMTGPLSVPADSFAVGKSHLVATGGKVGIGTASPDSRLTVLGGGWDLTNSEGDFKIGDGTYRLKMGIATGGGGAGDAFIRSHGGTGRLVLGSGTTNVLTVAGGKVGINTMTPTAALTVGTPQAGSALSTTMATNAGSLGGATGDMVKLANVGFMAGGNNVSLGLKALRTKTSTDWTGAAIGFLFDVDNTSPVNNSQFWLTADGRLGVGTSSPTEALDVNGKGRFRSGLQVDSTTMVTNLNAEMIDGHKLADLDARYGQAIEARYRYVSPNIPHIPICNGDHSCALSVVHVNLPPGNFVITFGVWLSNGNSAIIGDNSRSIRCYPTGAGPYALDGIDIKLPAESRTSSWTTTRSGPAQIDVYCAGSYGGSTGSSSGVSVLEAKITAVKVGNVQRQDGP